MSMTLKTRQVDGVTILDLSGRIVLGEGSIQIRDSIKELVAKGQKHILLNLGDVNYIDSSGLGELVSAFTTVKNAGGELKLLGLTKKVHGLQLSRQPDQGSSGSARVKGESPIDQSIIPGRAPRLHRRELIYCVSVRP